MTKEEAIHEIEKVFEPAFANYIIIALTEGATSSDDERQHNEALDMAIKALEQQPKIGYWIYTPQRRLVDETDEGGIYITDYRCTCSECGGDFGFQKMSDAYCKYCGAKMEVKEE